MNRKNIIGKSAIHCWLRVNYGKPNFCEACGRSDDKSFYDWANINNHIYNRNRDEFVRMCKSCHRKYDMTDEKLEQAKKNLYWVTGKKVKYAVGEKCPKTKLNAKQVVEIRKEYKLGNIFQKDLGAKYGISQRAVCSVVNRLSWRHIK